MVVRRKNDAGPRPLGPAPDRILFEDAPRQPLLPAAAGQARAGPIAPRSTDPRRRPVARVQIAMGPSAGLSVYLFPDRPVIIGRSRDCDLRIDDRSVSRQHCRIAAADASAEEAAATLLIEDLGSSNGTLLGDRPIRRATISGPVRVSVGSVVVIVAPVGGRRFAAPGTGSISDEVEKPAAAAAAATTSPITRRRPSVSWPAGRKSGQGTSRGPEAASASRDARPAAATSKPEIPGYDIFELLGAGGFGVVYHAVQLGVRRPVALKTIRSDLSPSEADILRFVREARVGASLEHPNIVAVFDAGAAAGGYYCAMELVLGETLAARITRGRKLPEPEALRIAIEIASGLAHAHERGVVHRDVKPANVILAAPRDQAKLADFGLAKAVSGAGASGVTRPGEGLGTISYTAPEQLYNAVAAGREADVYALGATIFRVLAGVPPFPGTADRATIHRILDEPAPSLAVLAPGVSRETAAIVARCLEKDPLRRYPSARELLQALTLAAARLQAPGPA